MTLVSDAYPCLVPLDYLGARIHFMGERILYSDHEGEKSRGHVRIKFLT